MFMHVERCVDKTVFSRPLCMGASCRAVEHSRMESLTGKVLLVKWMKRTPADFRPDRHHSQAKVMI
jgi:hypothetical protein